MDDALQLEDIQGLVARGYGTLPYACFLPITIDDAVAARGVLAGWATSVTSARAAPTAEAMNLAFTADGLRTLAGGSLPAGFSHPFISGMTSPYRSRFLGDVGDNAPRHWCWGGPGSAPVHLLALLYAREPSQLLRRVESMSAAAVRAGMRTLLVLRTDKLSQQEPFGFRDSISQPLIAGLPGAGQGPGAVRPGEFVLGYRNEYGQRTGRPLLPAAADPDGMLPRDPAGSGAADLGRNGTYLVFRQLRQDVEAFWRFVTDATRRADGVVDPSRRDILAAKLIGRWPSGAPLVLAPHVDDPAMATANEFEYHLLDPDGLACPLGAHVRRVNPRGSIEPDPGSPRSKAINNRHRLLRRGRSYNTGGGPDTTANERGLHFMCINANLARQYEFVQHTWVNNPVFNGLRDETDPLIGVRPDGSDFTEPAHPVRRRHRQLPQFVAVRGGAYFFVPGLAALRYLVWAA